MSIKASELLLLAEAMQRIADVETILGVDTEARDRCSTSRAYYAAFHAVKAWHDALPEPGSNTGLRGGEHQQLINRLYNPGPGLTAALKTQSRFLSRKLDELRARRITADYYLHESPLRSEAQAQCEGASRVIASL